MRALPLCVEWWYVVLRCARSQCSRWCCWLVEFAVCLRVGWEAEETLCPFLVRFDSNSRRDAVVALLLMFSRLTSELRAALLVDHERQQLTERIAHDCTEHSNRRTQHEQTSRHSEYV